MIAGSLINLNKYIGSDDAELILTFIKNININTAQIGSWVNLSDKLRVLLLNKSNYDKGVFEAHTKYKDVHIVINGKDTLHFADHAASTLSKSYDEEADYCLYNSLDLFRIELMPNSFVLVNQEEQHSNQITDSTTLKLVAKIL